MKVTALFFSLAAVFCVILSPLSAPAQTAPFIADCPIFPADNVWNTPIDHLPVDPNSSAYIATIGATKVIHPDFGSIWEGAPIGIPYNVVPGTQPKVPIEFDYADESDPGPYPIPPGALIEGGPDSDGDRHILVVDNGNCILYETYYSWPNSNGSWYAGSGAVFDLLSHDLRPDGWTSADAAGLPILPGLVRYEEVAAGEIRHAIRFTAPQTRKAYVWPARHYASSLTGTNYPPMGQRFRLKAGFNISGFSPEVQVILQALKKYGMILADNGSSWYISGVPDERWSNDMLVGELKLVKGSDFEAIDESSLMIDPASGQARQTTSDTEPPTVPAGLSASAVSTSQINLSWRASTDNVGVKGYRIYRAGSQVATTSGTSYQDTGLSPSTTYTYRVAAYDAAGNVSAQSSQASATTPALPDTQTPSVPAGLSAAAASPTQINLSWAASTDNVGVTGYRIYRAGSQIATTASTWYQDTGLSPSTTYTYRVAAYDAAGNVSAQSSQASATTPALPDTQTPSVPAGLSAAAASPTQINLSWAASTDNVGVTGYRIYRAGSQIATTASTWYQDTGLSPSTTYTYRVAAYDAAGNVSAQSSQVSATTSALSDTQAPTVPKGLAATVVSSTEIDLSWTASTDNVGIAGYIIYRNGTQIDTTTATSYKSIGLTASTSYTYCVAAYDGAGNKSAKSTTVTKTTQPATSTVFKVGDRVKTTGKVNVRSETSSSGKVLGTQRKGSLGAVVGGPCYWNNSWWWQVDFDNGPDGWVPQGKLKKVVP